MWTYVETWNAIFLEKREQHNNNIINIYIAPFFEITQINNINNASSLRLHYKPRDIYLIFSRNSEANASEFLENIEEMSLGTTRNIEMC